MIDNLSVLFSCTTVMWVVVSIVLLDRKKKRETRAKSENRGN